MTGALVVAPLAALYAAAVLSTGRPWPVHRTASGAASLMLCAVALGPLDDAADGSFAAHMAQHIVLGLLAPALLVAGAPVRLALAALAPGGRRALAGLLHAAPVRTLLQPVVAVGIAAAVLFATHVAAAVDAAERHPVLHAGEHALLFWSAVLAWASLLAVDPVPAAPGPVGLMAAVAVWLLPTSIVGAAYAVADGVLVRAYAAGGVGGEHAAGTIMLLAGPAVAGPIALVAAGLATWREELRQQRREQLEAAT